MGVVSSKRRFHVENELKSKTLDNIFDVIVTQEDTLLHKPHSAPLILTARLLYSPPELHLHTT
jgi:pyrophosphatase PpaX